jgi:hypothetical protein
MPCLCVSKRFTFLLFATHIRAAPGGGKLLLHWRRRQSLWTYTGRLHEYRILTSTTWKVISIRQWEYSHESLWQHEGIWKGWISTHKLKFLHCFMSNIFINLHPFPGTWISCLQYLFLWYKFEWVNGFHYSFYQYFISLFVSSIRTVFNKLSQMMIMMIHFN